MKRDKILLIVLLVLFVLSTFWGIRILIPSLRSEFVEWAAGKATEKLNTEVRIGSISLTRWAGIVVTDLSIGDPLVEGELFFSSPRIEVRFKPLKMIEGHVEFRLIKIDEPEIRIVRVDKKWNLKSFGKPKPPSEKKEEKKGKPFRMRIDRLILSDSWTRVSSLTREPFETRMDFDGYIDVGDGKVLIGMGKSSLNTTFVSFGEFLFEGDLTIDGKRFYLAPFKLEKDETRVNGSGYMEFNGPTTCHFDISSEHFDFAHIPPGVGTRDHLEGHTQVEVVLDGRLLNPDVTGTVRNCTGNVLNYGFDSLSGAVRYTSGIVEVRALDTGFCGGRLRGDFNFDFTHSPASYTADAYLDHFDVVGLPYPIPEEFSSDIKGELIFTGEGFNKEQFAASASVFLLKSSVGVMELDTLDATCSLSGLGLEIDESTIKLGDGTIDCNGRVLTDGYMLSVNAEEVDIDFFPNISPAPGMEGYLSFNGSVGGPYDRTDLNGLFRLSEFGLPEVFLVDKVEGSCQIEDLYAKPEGHVRLKAQGIDAAGVGLESLEAGVQLERDRFDMRNVFVRIDSTEFLEFSLRVDRTDGEFSFTASDLTIFHRGNASNSPGTLVVHKRPGKWVVDQSTVSFANGELTVVGEVGSEGDVTLQVKADSIDLYEAGRFLKLGRPLEGSFGAELSVNGTIEEPLMSLAVRTDNLYLEEARIDSFTLGASYASGMFFIDEFSLRKGNLFAEGSLNLPLDLALSRRERRLDPEGNVYGEVNVYVPLNFVNLLDTDFRASGGVVDGMFSISGKAGNPTGYGKGKITDGSGLYIPTNSYFEDINTVFHLEENSLVVDSLRARSLGGGVDASGQVEFSGLFPEELSFEIHLNNCGVHQIKHVAELTLDGDLVIEGHVRDPILRGSLQLMDGEFSIPFGRFDRNRARREVITFPISLDVIVQSRDNVWFRNKQANVEMEVILTVRGGPEGIKVSGEMRPDRGFYLFNGRRFVVEQGSISFVGSKLINPILDVNASRLIKGRIKVNGDYEQDENSINLHLGGYYDEVEFDIEVLDETGVRLPVSREEAFTLLLLDMTKREYDSRRGYYTERVQNQVAGLLTQQAASLLQDASPLDVITIDTDLFAGGDAGRSAQVSVGKYFAKRFFLSYSQDIMDPSVNNIAVEYGLRRRMFIVGQTNSKGDEFSVDFKYKLRY